MMMMIERFLMTKAILTVIMVDVLRITIVTKIITTYRQNNMEKVKK